MATNALATRCLLSLCILGSQIFPQALERDLDASPPSLLPSGLLTPLDDGLTIVDTFRTTESTARFFLSGLTLLIEDESSAVAPHLSGTEPWLELVSASAATTDAYSNSTGLAGQRSFVVDLDHNPQLGLGSGALLVATGRAAIAESTTPTFNWSSEADANSEYRVDFDLSRPFRYRLSGRALALPDPSPDIPGGAPDGIVVHGSVSIELRAKRGPIVARALGFDSGAQVVDVSDAGVLEPGSYTLIASADMANHQSPGNVAGRSEAVVAAALDLAPLNAPMNAPARDAFIASTGWTLPSSPLQACPNVPIPIAYSIAPAQVLSESRSVRARSQITSGSGEIDSHAEELAAVTSLTFVGTASARSAAPLDTPAFTAAFAHQHSDTSDAGVLRASGVAGASGGRRPPLDGAVSGAALSVSSYDVVFEVTAPTVVQLDGMLLAAESESLHAPSGGAFVELVRVDATGTPIQSLWFHGVGTFATAGSCVPFDFATALSPGRYRFRAHAIAESTPEATKLARSEYRYSVELHHLD